MRVAAPILASHFRKSLAIAAARPAFALGLRAATATILPLVIGEASGRPELAWVALGGWFCTIADPGGPYLVRAASMGSYAAAGAAAVAVGSLVSAVPWLAVPLLFVWGVAASLARVGGDAAGVVGTLVLITLCIALGTPAQGVALMRAELLLAGCAVAMVLALGLWPVHAYRPARLAVAACYRALGELAEAIADLGADRERSWSALVVSIPPRVRVALEQARVALGTIRRGRSAESGRGERLVVLFETADLLLVNLVAAGEALASSRDADTGWMRPIAAAFAAIPAAIEDRGDVPAVQLPDPPAAAGEIGVLQRRLVRDASFALRLAAALRTRAAHQLAAPAADIQVPGTSLRAALASDSALLRHALRLGITLAIGAALANVLGLVRGAWITVAIVIVQQPDSGGTFRRAIQRTLGTLLGAILAAVLEPLARSPTWLGVLLFPLSAVALALRPLNYGIFTVLVTPVFLLMAESLAQDFHLAGLRIVNTLIGGGLALASQLLWPTREREQLPGRLATLFVRLREYLDAVLSDPRAEPGARRAFGLAAANADASFQRHLGEIVEPPERIEAYTALLTYARRFRNALALAMASAADEAALRRMQPALAAALEALATAARERRAPPALPAIDESTPALERIARQLQVLRSALERLASESASDLESPGSGQAAVGDNSRPTTA